MSISPINTLAQAATAGAQSLAQLQLKLIGDRMTAQLNQKIADFKAQANDPMLPALQQQAAALNRQKTSYDTAQGQLVANGNVIADLDTQLGTLAAAANAGDATAFDQALGQATSDVDILGVVPLLPGFQQDGAGSLRVNGLGIQPSAAYNLATPAGQAQASADIAAAQNLVTQLSATTTQNEQIAESVSQALDTQITSINDQIDARRQSEVIDAAGQISQLQQQTQTRFHLIELAFGNVGESASLLQSAGAGSAPAGSILSIFDNQVGSAAQPTANIFSTLA